VPIVVKLKAWHLVALSGLVYACAQPRRKAPAAIGNAPPEPEEPVEPVRDLYVFAHDSRLVPIAMRAARRIEAASGVKVHVNEYGTVNSALPIFGSDFMCANGFAGRAGGGTSIAVARGCGDRILEETVLIHEMLHNLGVGHLTLPARGVMNEGKDGPLDKITADDLNALCEARECSVFKPEV